MRSARSEVPGRALWLAGATLALVALRAPAARAEGVFERLQALQAAGEATEALATANACSEPLERAQARLFVLHHAGDLAGALSAGLAGLRDTPDDPWLLERVTSLALDLGATELALRLLPRFEAVAAGQTSPDVWTPMADELRTRTRARATQAQQVQRSLTRARVTAALVGLVAALCLLWTCMPTRRARAQPS